MGRRGIGAGECETGVIRMGNKDGILRYVGIVSGVGVLH